jgi:capsular polysaccharide biosynthesis protein
MPSSDENLLGISPERLRDVARALLLARHYSEAARLSSWLQTFYADRSLNTDSDTLDVLARTHLGVRDTAGLLSLLAHPGNGPLSVWFWNDASIYLQREGEYAAAIKLLTAQKLTANWQPLLDVRLTELEQCQQSQEFVPYFRRAEFESVPLSERILLDEPLYSVFCDVKPTLAINSGQGAFNWPKTLKCISTADLQLKDATVLSDCSVLVGKVLLYETVKAVQQSWRFTHARCNDFFGQYSASDPWIQFTRAPKIAGSLDHAFLVPNPIEGIGHFIHDALPTIDSFLRYKTSVQDPTIVLRRLRPFDRQAIRDILLNYFGDVRIVELHPGEAVLVKNLFASSAPFSPSQGSVSPRAINSIRAHRGPQIAESGSGEGAKIYIARDDGQNIDERSRIDQAVVQSGLLDRIGFRKISLSQLAFRQQLAVWQTATHVAGVHGAGLMNIAFARDELKVTELIAPAAANYYTIAMFSAAMGFDYRAIDASKCVAQSDATLTADGLQAIEALLAR